MNRRSFGKTVGGALAGWVLGVQAVLGVESMAAQAAPIVPVAKALLDFVPAMSGGAIFSPLLSTKEFPEGLGYNFNSLIPPETESPAIKIFHWGAQSKAIQSAKMRLPDAADSFEVKRDRENNVTNLRCAVEQEWDDKEMREYAKVCPTIDLRRPLYQDALDGLRDELIRDGAGHAMPVRKDDKPVFILVCSMAVHRNIIRNDPSVRMSFAPLEYADTPLGNYLKSNEWAREHNGWIHILCHHMRRWNIINGEHVEASYYDPQGHVNRDYVEAKSEEALVFNPEVLRRNVDDLTQPFGRTNWVPHIECERDEEGNLKYDERGFPIALPPEMQDPLAGYVRRDMMAGWEPLIPQYGRSIIHRRC